MKVLYLHGANVERLPSKVLRAHVSILQNPFEGREILSSPWNSAKVSDLLCVLLSRSNNSAFLRSRGMDQLLVTYYSHGMEHCKSVKDLY